MSVQLANILEDVNVMICLAYRAYNHEPPVCIMSLACNSFVSPFLNQR